jgi:uncharacterized protein (TIGR00251 family)
MEPSTRLRLRVSPGARRTEIAGRHGDAWKIRVAAPPENGRANKAALRLLAHRLGLPRRALTIVSGHTAREKVVQLEGISAERVEEGLR